jgi:hypothetical protein
VTNYAYQLQDFADLVRITADRKQLPPAAVEKDYYVVHALRTLQSNIPDYFIFKGGTSLSKGWNLINRFSEDIDLLFVSEESITGARLSKGQLDRRMKEAENLLDSEECFNARLRNSSTGVHRAIYLTYPKNFDVIVGGGFSDTILVEMGVRGGTFPQAKRRIQSYVGEYAEQIGESDLAHDLAPFEVTCLDYRRTFVEKLFSIHAAFIQNKALGKMRHYYDLYQLAGLEDVRAFIITEEYLRVYKDVEDFSRTSFPGAELPEDVAFESSPALRPDDAGRDELKRNYAVERDLFFVEPPTIEEILERLQALEFIKS